MSVTEGQGCMRRRGGVPKAPHTTSPSDGLSIGQGSRLMVPALLDEAPARLSCPRFLPVVADGQPLVFPDATFDAALCQLGLMFFSGPAVGLTEFRRRLRPALWVLTAASRAPMWGILAETLCGALPERAQTPCLPFSLADIVTKVELS